MLAPNPDPSPEPPRRWLDRLKRYGWAIGLALAGGFVTWLLGVT